MNKGDKVKLKNIIQMVKEKILKQSMVELEKVKQYCSDGQAEILAQDMFIKGAEWAVKNCSIPDVIECLEQVNATLEIHGKVDANTDLHNKIRNTL